jgi:hypothetical protein
VRLRCSFRKKGRNPAEILYESKRNAILFSGGKGGIKKDKIEVNYGAQSSSGSRVKSSDYITLLIHNRIFITTDQDRSSPPNQALSF